MSSPVCTVIAGPNGAGKTTFALSYLRENEKTRNFVNADLIAAGLSPLAPEREAVSAGRLFLHEIQKYAERRESFTFETTLSGQGYLRWIRDWISTGWEVHLIYLWLPSVEMCYERVAERVARGGHNIPKATIERRYTRSVRNLLADYAKVCTSAVCVDNSLPEPAVVFVQWEEQRTILDPDRYQRMESTAE